MPKGRDLATLSALAGIALILRARGLSWGLPELYEEATPYRLAWDMWGWGPSKGFDPNPHFFKYPSLTVYLQLLGQGVLYLIFSIFGRIHSALDFRILHEIDRTPFVLTGRWITALLGAATVIPTFHIGRRVAGYAAGAAAGLLVALSPVLVEKSRVIEVDVPLTLLVALAGVGALRLLEAPTRGNCILTGIAVGLAASAKYPGAFAALPVLVAILLAPRRSDRPGRSETASGLGDEAARAGEKARSGSGSGRAVRAERSRPGARSKAQTRPSHAGSPPGSGVSARPRTPRAGPLLPIPWCMAWFGGAALLTLALTSPFLFLDFASFWRDLATEREHMRLGHFGSDQGLAFTSYAADWFRSLMGWPLGIASVAGLVAFTTVWRERWAFVLASYVVPFVLVLGSWSMRAERYLLPIVPIATVFATALAARLGSLGEAGRNDRRIAAVVGVATVLFAVPLAAGNVERLKRVGPDSRTQAKRWIEANVPAGSFIASEQLGPALMSLYDLRQWDPELRQGLHSRGFQPRVYALQAIPMFQVGPERSARFYEPALFELADYVVVTGAVRDRYRRDPSRFARQLAFYSALERSFVRAQEFKAAGAGPDVVLYKNPRHDRPFPMRPPAAAPDLERVSPGVPTGGEPQFYYNLGLNHEAFGFLDAAARCYERGLRYPSATRGTYGQLAQRLAQVLVRAGQPAQALAVLDRAAAQAPDGETAGILRDARRKLASGAPAGAAPAGR